MNTIKSTKILAFMILGVILVSVTTPEQELKTQQKDFAIFKQALLKIDAAAILSENDSVSQMLQQAENEFNTKVLSPIEEFKLLSRCASALHSSNTQLFPGKEVITEYVRKKKALPFDMIMINKRLYVTNKSADGSSGKKKNKEKVQEVLPEGAEILKIDGKTIDEWIIEISQFMGCTGRNTDYAYITAGSMFDFYRFLATTEQKNYVDVVYSVKSKEQTKQVRLTEPPVELISSRMENAGKVHKKDQKTDGKYKSYGNEAGCLIFPTFNDQDGFKYSKLLKKTFEKISKKKQFKVLIIDLRGNNGGSVQSELLGYLIGQPKVIGKVDIPKKPTRKELKKVKRDESFRTYKQEKRKLKKIKKKYPNFNGELYSSQVDPKLVYKGNVVILTDEHTLGSAALLTAQLQFFRNARIAGALPACSPSDAGGTMLQVKLPGSSNILTVDPTRLTTQTEENVPQQLTLDLEIVANYDAKPSNYKKNKADVAKKVVDHYSKIKE